MSSRAVVAVGRSRAALSLLLGRGAAALSSHSYSDCAASFACADSIAAAKEAAKVKSAASNGVGGEAPPGPRKRWGLRDFGAFAAFAGALGGVGYVSYAYTLKEVEQMTWELKKSLTSPLAEDASQFEKLQAMAYSTAMKVPVAAIELYSLIREITEDHVQGFTEPTSDKLLRDLLPQEQHIFTLVLDLNETLIYSDWQRDRGWRTFKRPGVDAFVEHMANFYEVIVYTDQLTFYVEPVMDRLDTKGYISARLSRPATKYQHGKHYRDLSKLNRNPAQVIYMSGHALESCLQPENCVAIKPWKLEKDDTQLLDLIPFLEYVAMARPPDIRAVLASYQGRDIAAEFKERSKEIERLKQKTNRSIWRR